jgi:hypothetical protein
MKLIRTFVPLVVALSVNTMAFALDADSKAGLVGKVSFPTSCDPKVQPAFTRAVAMLHSFWFNEGEKAFR